MQVNQSCAQLVSITCGEDGLMGPSVGAPLFGIPIAAIVGIHSIPNVTSMLVPAMAGIYFAACLIVILVHVNAAPQPVRYPATGQGQASREQREGEEDEADPMPDHA